MRGVHACREHARRPPSWAPYGCSCGALTRHYEPRRPPRRAKPTAPRQRRPRTTDFRRATDLARRYEPGPAAGGRQRQGGAGHSPPCRIMIGLGRDKSGAPEGHCHRLRSPYVSSPLHSRRSRLHIRRAKLAARHGGAVTSRHGVKWPHLGGCVASAPALLCVKRCARPCSSGAGGVGSIPVNSDAQNVPSFRRW